MRIIGLDVGRGSAVLCCLDKFPVNIQRHYRELVRARDFIKVNCDGAGVDKLLHLNPDAIVLEPTGHWYAHFWVTVAKQNKIEVYWISHTDLDKLRGSYGFTNKRDSEDALCLAASYFDDRFVDDLGNKRYLSYYYTQSAMIVKLRELFLAKEQLQKLRSNLISQLRQRLAYEYLEIVKSSLIISPHLGYTPVVGWLARCHSSTRIENKYRASIVHQLGIDLTDYTQQHAKLLVDIETRISDLYESLSETRDVAEFQRYFEVFSRFGFGLDNQILLLYHIYPFEKFLHLRQPMIERDRGKNGKLHKRDRSLRKFQAYLGMSYSYKQSGDKKTRKFHGSTIVRSHLYAWAVCMVAPKNQRIKSDIGKQLCDRYQELRVNVKGKDALIRILFKATRMLYYELLNELIY